MLIFRYLLKETLKSQLAVFLVLMAIFITHRFVRVLADASDGEIPASLVMGFLALSTPYLASLILPLSLFLGIMLAHGRLYVDSEMTVMRACGISEWYVTRVMLALAALMAVVTAVLTLWLAPLSQESETQLEEQAGAETGLSALIAGRFQETGNQKAVIFVHEIGTGESRLQKVFLAQHERDDATGVHIVYSQQGDVQSGPDGTQQLLLQQGVQYEGEQGSLDYQVVEFEEYQVQIGEQQAEQKRRKLTAYSTQALLEDDSLDAIAELQWRLAIPLSLPFLVLIAVPLSAVDPRQGRFGKMFPALLLYLGYFMLLMAGRKVLEDGKLPPSLGLWWVHGVMLLIGSGLVIRGRSVGVRVRAMFGGRHV
ncbi:LPS export ABC transporter permease LptF [Aestuariibacter halophilus]|uniref:Lipopolysaccharide export system permease protein LptF n=1 Tax=Fluctibacter halophilus TaxID=226011 RepID=A0ABS8GB80_9ALTE|nr:LPS export ABC transporter permease LptF [Aestuariibacter halophilus]MCC2617316.1 LPS export ABC transporter permease LptF [Aestuariibacter halophilus]